MSFPTGGSDPQAGRRRSVALSGAAALIIAIVVVIAIALADDGDDGTGAQPSSTAAIAPASSLASDPAVSVRSGRPVASPDPASNSAGQAPPVTDALTTSIAAPTLPVSPDQPPPASPGPGVPPTTDAPPIGATPPADVSRGTIPGDDAIEVCSAIMDRLHAYRSLAVDAPVSSIEPLLPALEEFELDIFTAAELQDWGDRIIEQLVNVRREWSTALSASELGDSAEAQARASAALEFLDAAIAVPCPRSAG